MDYKNRPLCKICRKNHNCDCVCVREISILRHNGSFNQGAALAARKALINLDVRGRSSVGVFGRDGLHMASQCFPDRMWWKWWWQVYEEKTFWMRDAWNCFLHR